MVMMWRAWNNDLVVAEVLYASWEGDGCTYEDINGETVNGTGLYFYTADDGCYIVPGYSQSECEGIIRRLYTDGKYDLSRTSSYIGGQAYLVED